LEAANQERIDDETKYSDAENDNLWESGAVLNDEDAFKSQEIDSISEEKETPQTDVKGKENEGFHYGKTKKLNSLEKVESLEAANQERIDDETKYSDAEKDNLWESEAVLNDEKDMENKFLTTLKDEAIVEVIASDIEAKKNTIDSFAKMEVNDTDIEAKKKINRFICK